MLKWTFMSCTAALFVVALAPGAADARDGRSRADRPAAAKQAKARSARSAVRAPVRSASMGANGLCQRDTGTPSSQLDMRNRCDVEKFWQRIIDLGSSGDSD